MKKIAGLVIAFCLVSSLAARVRERFGAGDVWRYHTRPSEPNSTLTILKIEDVKGVGTVVHIRVDGVRLKNCSGGPEPDSFQHMPFTKESF